MRKRIASLAGARAMLHKIWTDEFKQPPAFHNHAEYLQFEEARLRFTGVYKYLGLQLDFAKQIVPLEDAIKNLSDLHI